MGGRQKPLMDDPLVELPASMRAALSSGGGRMNTDEEVLSNDMAHTRAMPGRPSSSSLSIGLSRAPPRVCLSPAMYPVPVTAFVAGLPSHCCLCPSVGSAAVPVASATFEVVRGLDPSV